MKKRAKRLQLSKETLCSLDLQETWGGATFRQCPETISNCVTDCDACGNTNFNSCACSIVGC